MSCFSIIPLVDIYIFHHTFHCKDRLQNQVSMKDKHLNKILILKIINLKMRGLLGTPKNFMWIIILLQVKILEINFYIYNFILVLLVTKNFLSQNYLIENIHKVVNIFNLMATLVWQLSNVSNAAFVRSRLADYTSAVWNCTENCCIYVGVGTLSASVLN